ncbi:hypothetical protein CLOBY_08370 [Clostridium saccharobutylicum]|uniref:hypothetical protein n=1 Tax=Clostridium saccharobutylicum TaxID=169679 RepID=UPI000983A2DA|nr:hypothetical protein [Clostridium saccharobutylicum]AQS08727.1 hypothetical protein CLOBY_08370 [Clostridium saccharobutylicum]MBC2438847.1 hypothetical protein [Clostridium saccharobutylicum]NSB91121.1 hypothetical protein [Clostridium saccharobutylicum]NYC28928.1 hypothetical protein [Clostridium saccharobutylicum]OOM18990.1 hypothetical protein CLSAB_01870 [Clostridium saccharobutylicum]
MLISAAISLSVGRNRRQEQTETSTSDVPETSSAQTSSPISDDSYEYPENYSKGYWEYMEDMTGLAGAALVVYLIISEGSRLFPPRNLVPVP